MMIYKVNFPYYYVYLRNSINYVLMVLVLCMNFTYRVDNSPLLPHFFANKVR